MPTENPFLKLTLHHRQGPLTLDVTFALTQPWTVLFGPSGSGKTTILRIIAGLERPHSGILHLHGHALLNTTTRTFIPPHHRPIRTAGQAARLFSNMTIEQNIRYGIAPPQATATLIAEILDLFRIASLARKPPAALSGGEQQRVSVARAVVSAIATKDSLLLLDEPFSGLDLGLRDTLAVELQACLSKHHTPVLSVTHDVGEAFLLNAEVIRLHDGRVTERGPVAQVLAPERRRILDQLGVSSAQLRS